MHHSWAVYQGIPLLRGFQGPNQQRNSYIWPDSLGNPYMEFWEGSRNGTFSQELWSNVLV